MDYLLLSVIRDEAEHFSQVIDSIIKQTKRPSLWLIVDDNSKDETSEILSQFSEEWIITKRHIDRTPASLLHYSQLLSKNAEYLAKLAAKQNLSWGALAIVDGDVVPEPTYFSKLLEAFNIDRGLGIISGDLVEPNSKRMEYNRWDRPWGAATLYRRKCMDDIGGLSPTPSHSSIEIVLAQKRGYSTSLHTQTMFTHLRPISTKYGLYNGYVQNGGAARWLGTPITFAVAKAIKLGMSRYPIRGLGYIIGYLGWRGGRCQIPEVQTSYRNRWRVWWRSREKQ
ncbi:MAG TPA: glycosyltransferase family 2 protein [Flavobacteriales bacterium]|nr:glycosyltransferase family 2 protein [Flavobacteriales bacterium]